MSRQYKRYLVTKTRNEDGQDLLEQWIVRARSRKEAIEEVLEGEEIIIEEKPYVSSKDSDVHSESDTEDAPEHSPSPIVEN